MLFVVESQEESMIEKILFILRSIKILFTIVIFFSRHQMYEVNLQHIMTYLDHRMQAMDMKPISRVLILVTCEVCIHFHVLKPFILRS